MINQGNNVPDNTIAVFRDTLEDGTYVVGPHVVEQIIKKSERKREWFTSDMYRCLPLSIGNQYGFIITSLFNFAVEWNGGDKPHDTKIYYDRPMEEIQMLSPSILTHFGHGIVTVNPPFTLRTPPGVNLMTINPPNVILPNITVMTGVVETDNLRRNFTFNLKIQMPNIRVNFPAGVPISGFIPILRHYADEFNIVDAQDLFDKDLIDEENRSTIDASIKRSKVEPTLPGKVGRDYFIGQDVYGNKFPDHQLP
jgi:hypothetical protein